MKPSDDYTTGGFTLTELMIAIAIIGVLTAPVLGVVTSLYVDAGRSKEVSRIQSELQAAARSLSEDIKMSASVLSVSTLPDSNAPSGGWHTNSSAQILVLEVPAFKQNGEIIYNASNSPYRNQVVYYVESGNLLKRTIKNLSAPGNATVTTCPSSVSSQSCPADPVMMSNLSSSSFVLLDKNGSPVASEVSAYAIRQNFSVSKTFARQTVEAERSIITSFRNKV